MSQPIIKVFIGRFQPFHLGHLKVLRAAIDTSDHVVVVIGSAQEQVPTFKNPWDVFERHSMIKLALRAKERDKVSIVHQEDNQSSDAAWVRAVQKKVFAAARVHFPKAKNFDVRLVGCHKGADTYYLKLYKGWGMELVPHSETLNATDIRKAFFVLGSDGLDLIEEREPEWTVWLPPSSAGYLAAWRNWNSKAFSHISTQNK